MSQINRCLVCNGQALYPTQFCSQECKDEFNQLMEEMADQEDEVCITDEEE